MPIYEWKRRKDTYPYPPDEKNPSDWEYMTTETTDTPPGGWQRVYSLSIGSVRGAGGSPSRKVNTRGSS